MEAALLGVEAALLDASGAGVFEAFVPAAGDLTDLLPLAGERALDEAGVEDSGLTAGLGVTVGCAADGAAGASLDADADAACGGLGDAEEHGVTVMIKALWVAVLPAPELEAGGVSVGVGTAEPVGFGVGAVVVGDTPLGVGITAGGGVGATEGITICGDLLTFDGFLAAGGHVEVGDGLAVRPFPFPAEAGLELVPPGTG